MPWPCTRILVFRQRSDKVPERPINAAHVLIAKLGFGTEPMFSCVCSLASLPQRMTLSRRSRRYDLMLLPSDPAHAFMPYPPVPVPHAPTGTLEGMTFAAKDLFDVEGYPTGCGSPHLLALSGIKTRTAPIVQKLLDSGARLVGKTITDELAFSMSGKNAHFGTPVNGGAPDRIPGGSSSGSAAAVSNGLCDFALGTDTGGSVRAPANHCGLFGIRPTHGRVSLEACHDLSPSFDTCGFFTRDGRPFRASARLCSGRIRRLCPINLGSSLRPTRSRSWTRRCAARSPPSSSASRRPWAGRDAGGGE